MFFGLPEYVPELLIWKKADLASAKNALQKLISSLENLAEEKFSEKAKTEIDALAEKLGRGEVFWPLRVALSGRENSPGPLEILEVLGKAETLRRLKVAQTKLN